MEEAYTEENKDFGQGDLREKLTLEWEVSETADDLPCCQALIKLLLDWSGIM